MTARDRAIGIVVVCVVAVVAAWMLVVSPQRDQASKLGDQIKAEQAQLDGVRGQVAAGELAKGSYASSYTMLARLGEAVPSDDNVPSLIFQLQGAANSTKVDFRTLNLSGGGSSAVSSPSAAQGATAALPPGATVGSAGLPIEPFVFTFRGNFFHLSNFFGRLQAFVVASNNRVSVSGRLMTLNGISLGPGPGGFPQISATISATTYLVPASQGITNGATPAGPSPASSQPVSTPSSGSPAPAAVVSPPGR